MIPNEDHSATLAIDADPGASLFVWGVWALLFTATMLLVLKHGSRFPQRDEWEMISVLTGDEPVSLHWLWRQHGWWPRPGQHDPAITEHRTPLFKLTFLALLKLTHGDFRSGSVFSVLALGALAGAMIGTARSVRGRQDYADAYFPLVILSWGHEGYLWSQQLYFVLVSLVASMLLLMIVRRQAPFTVWSAGLFMIGLVLLVLSGPGGLAYVPALSLLLGYSALLSWRGTEPHRKMVSLLIMAMACVVLTLVPLYFVGLEKPGYRDYHTDLRTALKAAITFLVTGLGPTFARETWPQVGLGLVVIAGISTFVLCVLWWTRPQERFRAAGLLCFVGGIASLTLAMGMGRSGPQENGNFDRHTFLVIPALCCLYLIWVVFKSPISRVVQMSLFALACVALGPAVRDGREARFWTQYWVDKTDRLLRAGIPPAMLADQDIMLIPSDFHDQSLRREYTAERLRMLQKAGIEPYRHLPHDVAMTEIPFRIEPSMLEAMAWDGSVGHGSGPNSSATFDLIKPQLIYAIRVRYRYRGTSGTELKVSWKKEGDAGFSDAEMPPYEKTADREGTMTIWVNDTITQFRIRPDNKPSTFEIREIVLLVPAGRLP